MVGWLVGIFREDEGLQTFEDVPSRNTEALD
jgi:hypothetical protein